MLLHVPDETSLQTQTFVETPQSDARRLVQRTAVVADARRLKQLSWSSDEVGSACSGSSIETQVDTGGRRGHRKKNNSVRSSSRDIPFTHGEERKIRNSLQGKLLSDDGARLSRLERRLLRSDHSLKGSVSVSTFKAALAAESKSSGVGIKSDEALWLVNKLKGRNGRNVKIGKMRALLENGETGTGHRSGSGARRQAERNQRRQHTTRKNKSSTRGGERGRRRGRAAEDGGGLADSRGTTTSESDTSSLGHATRQWRSSPPPPARWAIRHGTVGEWLHEVAAPMVRGRHACS